MRTGASVWSFALASFILAVACSDQPQAAAPKPPPASSTAKPTPENLPPAADLSYGVYLNEAKVGFMRSTVRHDGGPTEKGAPGVELGLELSAKVGGMGTVSSVEVNERRWYDPKTRALAGLYFEQKAATGSVIIKGHRDGGELVLKIQAGSSTQEQRFPIKETLDDAMATMRLAAAAQVGASATSEHFDPSLQKSLRVKHTVVAIEEIMLAGVSTRAVRIDSVYEGLDVTETAWLDQAGKVLESRVGGFFVARLEPPEVARRLDYSQDLLVAAVVKPPKPLERTPELPSLTVTFTGFGGQLPPSSPRQVVSQRGDAVVLKLSRESALPAVPLSKPGSKELASFLEATPFIQSAAPQIVDAAKQAVGEPKDLAEAVTRLTGFVYRHVRDEYVPAYSNALEALESGRGDCTEHSVLFVALARALGIPARVAVGIAYWPPGGGFGWHAWAEVAGPDGRWYAVDPTWNQPIADATHVKLADGGPAEQARIVMLLGRLKIIALDT